MVKKKRLKLIKNTVFDYLRHLYQGEDQLHRDHTSEMLLTCQIYKTHSDNKHTTSQWLFRIENEFIIKLS